MFGAAIVLNQLDYNNYLSGAREVLIFLKSVHVHPPPLLLACSVETCNEFGLFQVCRFRQGFENDVPFH